MTTIIDDVLTKLNHYLFVYESTEDTDDYDINDIYAYVGFLHGILSTDMRKHIKFNVDIRCWEHVLDTTGAGSVD